VLERLTRAPFELLLLREALPPLPAVPGYAVTSFLGMGGMGVVYLAEQHSPKRPVALKMIRAGWLATQRQRGRFQLEADSLAKLQHPHIVQVFEVGAVEGQPWFAMEHLGGGSLSEPRRAPSTPRAAAELMACLAEAVQHAHDRGVIHRDLKPGNVLFTRDGLAKICDFGLARLASSARELTQDVPVGTPSYMAPEQAGGAGGAVTVRTDVYALGAILYHLLTGRPPFQGESREQVLEQVRTAEPARPRKLRPGVPRDLETICLKCLEKNPGERYPTATALADDLRRYLDGRPVAARPVGWLERSWRWCRRNPRDAALAAVVVLLVLAGGGGAWQLHQQRDAARQADQEALGVLGRARGLLDEGWHAHDLAKLTAARAEAERAVAIARSGGAGAAVRQEAAAFREEAEGRLGRAQKTRALLVALLDVSAPREARAYPGDGSGRVMALAQPNVDEQYAAAFRRWGLDVDHTPEAEALARLGEEPEAVVQELIAALDAWMLERRWAKRPEARWRRLWRLAEQLDRSDRRRQLRALLIGGAPPRAESVAGLVGASPWPALWELARGNDWRRLQELRGPVGPATGPVLTVVLLAQASSAVGDAAAAEQLLRQALAARPDQVVLLDALGRLLERQGPGRLGEAIEHYRAARALRPRQGLALGNALVHAGRAAEGEALFWELVRQQPDNPDRLVSLGVALSMQGKSGEAEEAARKALALQPDLAEAHNNLGAALSRQGKLAEAEGAFRKAVALQPELALAHSNLGSLLPKRGKLVEAEAACRKALALQPGSTLAHYNLGVALHKQGKWVEATAAYRKAIEFQPGLALAHNNLGVALREQGRLGEGVAAFRKAIELQPDLALAHGNLGNALRVQGKLVEAVAACRKAVTLQPDYAAAYDYLGAALGQQGRLAEAEAAFDKAIELQPGLAAAHGNLGLVLLLDGQFNGALAALKKGRELLPAGDPRREGMRRQLQYCQRQVVLDARLPAVLNGTERPASATEQIEFARLCALKKLYAASARLYAGAFAGPSPAKAVRPPHRYDAACSAALAAEGRGKDGAGLGGEQRAALRRYALTWLRADLAAWTKVVEQGPPQARRVVQAAIRRWQTDRDLCGLREEAALAKLPAAERRACRKLWADVGALLQRTQGKE
jgi:serine/threonine-protein kinase